MAKTAKILKPTENRLAKKRAPPSKNAAIVRTVPVNRKLVKSISISFPLMTLTKQIYRHFFSSVTISSSVTIFLLDKKNWTQSLNDV